MYREVSEGTKVLKIHTLGQSFTDIVAGKLEKINKYSEATTFSFPDEDVAEEEIFRGGLELAAQASMAGENIFIWKNEEEGMTHYFFALTELEMLNRARKW